MRQKLISCEIFFRELCHLVSQSPHVIDVEFLPKGLHDLESSDMRSRVQARIDAASGQGYERIILGYALCNNGTLGIRARDTPVVIPRAHDCITLFLGSRERYRSYFDENPGTYFHTTGWLERSGIGDDLRQFSIPEKFGMNRKYEELVEEFGEDNADYIWETLGNTTPHYSQFTYIAMGLPQDPVREQESRSQAEKKGWGFTRLDGDLGMLRRLLDGPWEASEFLVIQPGEELAPTYDDEVVKCRRCPACCAPRNTAPTGSAD